MWDMVDYQKAHDGEKTLPGPYQWLAMTNSMQKLGFGPEKRFDGKEFPVMALSFQTMPHLWVSDPDIAQEIFVSKNAHHDKDPEQLIMFADIMGQSFAFSSGDETWKAKRRASAHAFYKDRLRHMLETLKETVQIEFTKWDAKVKQNGSHEINMAKEFFDIFARNIIHICFGEDISDDSFVLKVLKNGVYVDQTVSVKDFIFVLGDQLVNVFYKNAMIPINWLFQHTNVVYRMTTDSKILKSNCQVARNWVQDYINKRRAGTRKSTVANKSDILSLMLEDPDVFTDEVIIDEMLGFFGAGADPTSKGLQTIVSYLAKNSPSVQKIRAEFNAKFTELCDKKPSIASMSLADQLKETVTIDHSTDLEYLSMVMQEGLRFQDPASITAVYFDKDVVLAKKLRVKKGDRVRILNWALHTHSDQW